MIKNSILNHSLNNFFSFLFLKKNQDSHGLEKPEYMHQPNFKMLIYRPRYVM